MYICMKLYMYEMCIYIYQLMYICMKLCMYEMCIYISINVYMYEINVCIYISINVYMYNFSLGKKSIVLYSDTMWPIP